MKVLDGTENNSSGYKWLISTVYYDDKYRPIQALRDLYSIVTTDNAIVSTLYDFVGKTMKILTKQVFRGNTNSVTETYIYDHADRLTQVKHKLNSGTEVILVSMEYNDLGQLKRKTLHGQIGSGIQDLNYSYNIRGWLEKINNPEVNPTASSTQKLNLGLYYNNVPTGFSVLPQFTGNISAIAWNTPARTEALSPAYKQGYGFTYDALNRLTTSVYGESTNFATSPGANNEGYTYDLNGNIKSLSRYLKNTGLIDNLTYTYKNSNISNLLDKVEDASGTIGFINGANTTNEYSFDGNGNLTADLNKGYTSILYNYLNLPKRVGTATAGQYISYIYDAAGTKIAKVSTAGVYAYYAGNFVYSGSSLNYIINEEGHVEPTGAYKYYLKDHLGSVRMVVSTTGTGGTIEQQTDYYPFGMTIAEYNGSVIDYRYNGKELQDDLINGKKLDWYDYGARFYDPQIGRWHIVDPFVEKYYDLSPYNYTANNPILFIDPNGKDIYGFDNNTGRLSLVKPTEDDFDRIQIGNFSQNGTFAITDNNYLDLSKGALHGKYFENIAEYGIVFQEGVLEEGIKAMKFLSFSSNIELSAWAFKSDNEIGLSISPWSENTATESFDVYSSPHRPGFGTDKIGYLGNKYFQIHTHPGTKDGQGGFGKPSPADKKHIESNLNYPNYIISKREGIVQYFIDGSFKNSGIK